MCVANVRRISIGGAVMGWGFALNPQPLLPEGEGEETEAERGSSIARDWVESGSRDSQDAAREVALLRSPPLLPPGEGVGG